MRAIDDELMTVKEVAKYLHVGCPAVYNLIKKRDIPGYWIGRVWRCRKSELMSWLDEQVVTAKNM